jgi:hypothetical protein
MSHADWGSESAATDVDGAFSDIPAPAPKATPRATGGTSRRARSRVPNAWSTMAPGAMPSGQPRADWNREAAIPREGHWLRVQGLPVNKPVIATAHTISSRISTSRRAATVGEDMIGWVTSGSTCLLAPQGEIRTRAGGDSALPRFTRWDAINEPGASGHHRARVISFSWATIASFHDRFGRFTSPSGMR